MPKYELSIWLARLLFIAGWAILLAGVTAGVALAAVVSETSEAGLASGRDADVYFPTVLGAVVTSFFASLLTWSAAYMVLLLSDIEANTRQQ